MQRKKGKGLEDIAMTALLFSVREQVTPTFKTNGNAIILC